jgi:putative endonuclease
MRQGAVRRSADRQAEEWSDRPFFDVGSSTGSNRRATLGRLGEERAATHYRAHGYAILARNWRCAHGEIDLICARGRTLVICEVKARSRTAQGHPLEAVTPVKQRRLRRLAAAYVITQSTYWEEIRFDVATLLGRDLDVVEGAF